MPEYGSINQEVVKDQVEQAAAALAILPIGWWASWIAFFIECLEKRTGDQEDRFNMVLDQVARHIRGIQEDRAG